MRTRLTISAFCFATFLTINVVAASMNAFLGNFTPGHFDDLADSTVVCLVTSTLIFLSSLPHGRLAYHWRIPIFRVVFWVIVCLFDYGNKSLQLVSELLAMTNGYLCFFYSTFLFKVHNGLIPDINNAPIRLIFIDIIGVALYEILIIRVGMYFSHFLENWRGRPRRKNSAQHRLLR
jgi:hypothetical protein